MLDAEQCPICKLLELESSYLLVDESVTNDRDNKTREWHYYKCSRKHEWEVEIVYPKITKGAA